MGQSLADGEMQLVGIEPARKHRLEHIGNGRPGRTGLARDVETLMVMRDDLIDSLP